MNVRSMHDFSAEWFGSASIDWDLWFSNGFENTQCVNCRLLQRNVSMNGADAKEIQGRMIGS